MVQSPRKATVSCSSFKWTYGVNGPGEIVAGLVGISSHRSEKRLNEKIEKFIPPTPLKKKETKSTEGGIVINNVAPPEMLLTSSPVQQFHPFFFFPAFWFIYPFLTSQFILISPLSSVVSHRAARRSSAMRLRALFLLSPPRTRTPLVLRPPLAVSSFLHSSSALEWEKKTLEKKRTRDDGAVEPPAQLHKSETPLVKNQRKNSAFFSPRREGKKNSFQHRRGYRGQLLLAINFTHT